MLNREIYAKDPLANKLANNGVAVVKDDLSAQALDTLRYELDTFVCDGEYEKGLDKILSTFLSNLVQEEGGISREQPGVWISGFYGSGKSHLAKMLRTLWVDQKFADGSTARSRAALPDEIKALLTELSTQGKRLGGLHACSGTLGSGADGLVRMPLLNIIFKSVGLPEEYHLARFVLWLKRKNYFEQVQTFVQEAGENWHEELSDFHVSAAIADAVISVNPDMAGDRKEFRELIKNQFPEKSDVTNDQMVEAIKDALTTNGEFPLTLIVLDEVQQFIGDDAQKAYGVQEVVETCSKHFTGKVLFVATGQSALSGTPSLMRLKGRFQMPIQLFDTDVESVIRKIILLKKESARSAIQDIIDTNRGEISRHLRGSKIEYRNDDENIMVADYPVLPIRNRFWEKVLRIVDTNGTVSQLRNQLRVVHEATRATADQPIGHMVPGDFIYGQNASDLLQSAVLSKEVYETIQKLSNSMIPDEQLQGRLLSLVFLIGKLPTDDIADIGVRATDDMLADLLVEDISKGSSELRTRIPDLMEKLQANGIVMAMETRHGKEYRLQTQESSAWHETYRNQEADLVGNSQRVEQEREDLFHKFVNQKISKVRLSQGNCKEPRQVLISYDAELPSDSAKKIYAWVQDGWSTSEKDILADARNIGSDNPTIFVYIPDRNKSELQKVITARKAAEMTIDIRGLPSTPEGRDARTAMETRLNEARKQEQYLLQEIFDGVRVFKAGGDEITSADDLTDKVEHAARASLVRLFGEFDAADHIAWGKVYDRARKDGGESALELVNHTGDVDKHPVCSAILKYIGPGKKGAEIREQFKAAPFGWPQDAIDGGLFTLLAAGLIKAQNAARKPVDAKTLERSQLTQAFFEREAITLSTPQLIKVRKLLGDLLGSKCNPGEEAGKIASLIQRGRELAYKAGGDAPRPQRPDTQLLDDIGMQAGNQMILSVFEHSGELQALFTQWQTTAEQIDARIAPWSTLQSVASYCRDLAFGKPLQAEIDAIRNSRSLLSEPDPVVHLLKDSGDKLRNALQRHIQEHKQAWERHMGELEQDSNWQQLNDDQRRPLLAAQGISTIPETAAGSLNEVLDALEHCPLNNWVSKTEALQVKFAQVRIEAARLLEPKVQRIDLPRRTLKTDAELDAWLKEAEAKLRAGLNDGPVMV